MNEELDEDFKKCRDLMPPFDARLENPDFRFLFARALISGNSVLDVGCGDGLFLKILENSTDLRLSGIDLSQLAWKSAADNVKSAFLYNDIECIKEKYDTVTALQVMEHVDDPKSFLLKLASLAKNRIIITVPIEDKIQDPMHKTRFSLYSLNSLISDALGHENFVVFMINKFSDDIPPNCFAAVISVNKEEDLSKRKPLVNFHEDYQKGLDNRKSRGAKNA